ncbi:MAG: hypothetical protein ACLGIA_12360 [Actinomycetes bacterium]
MKRSAALLSLLLGGVLALLPLSAGAGEAAATSAYCGITWGSLPKQAAPMSAAPLVDVRAGRHTCYDRLVLDVAGAAGGYSVRYVPEVTMDGSGEPVPLRGGAFLSVVAHVPAYDENGNDTYHAPDPRELVDVTGYRAFRQVAFAGSFEGYTTIGLGVRARLPFRVFVLDGSDGHGRLVVDVAHSW